MAIKLDTGSLIDKTIAPLAGPITQYVSAGDRVSDKYPLGSALLGADLKDVVEHKKTPISIREDALVGAGLGSILGMYLAAPYHRNRLIGGTIGALGGSAAGAAFSTALGLLKRELAKEMYAAKK